MGLLDTGSRWMDIVLTPEGRLALAEGTFEPFWFGFNDNACAYLKGGTLGEISWLGEPHRHLSLEAFTRTGDSVSLRTNENGQPDGADFNIFAASGEPVLSGSRIADAGSTLTDEEISRLVSESWGALLGQLANLQTVEFSNEFPAIETRGTVREERWTEAVRVSQHPVIQESSTFGSLRQLQFLPPVQGDGEALGNFQRIFPVPEPLDQDDIDRLLRERFVWSRLDLQSRETSFRFGEFLDGSFRPLLLVPIQTSGAIRLWSAGIVVPTNFDGAEELHFFRIFWVIAQ
jgi:hypothetical protein